MLPCLTKDSLKLLVGTADERYTFSPEYFRETHFPQVMHRYHGNYLAAEVTESELLDELKTSDVIGNRVYLLFGSTGSGKSELLCWIRDQWINQKSLRPVVRISRSELNPQLLIKKCYEAFNIDLDMHINENQWELLQKKPVTIINQIVWSALAEMLEMDEDIVPIALLMRHEIEKNIVRFTKQIENGKITEPLEILYQNQFEDLILGTSLPVRIDYENLRKLLSIKLDRFLFDGWDMNSLFKNLSNQLVANNIRPLLLIDDLVQSVNLYANDLLDQLITLEEGNWDVVIGLTPGSLHDSSRGSEITKRIQTLDTIDDRVKKLWLSDETGLAFYNLDRNQSVAYMAKYLYHLKASQGFICSDKCLHINDCKNLKIKNEVNVEEKDIVLLPFNNSMVKRVYDGIPVGKGKLRYMVLYTKEVIRFFQKGNKTKLSSVLPLVSRELFAEYNDVFIKTLAEWLTPENQQQVVLSRELLKHFGYQLPDQTIFLHPLGETQIFDITDEEKKIRIVEAPISHVVIRDWVEGKTTNPELLEPVRSGVACLVHDVTKATNILRQFTPKSNAAIQKKEVYKGSKYPINFDGNSDIVIKRGFAALEVSNLHQLKPYERAKKFQKISSEWEVAKWVLQSEILHNRWVSNLEQALKLTLPQLSYMLKEWVNGWGKINESGWVNIRKAPFTKELNDVIEELYLDWFSLRDNMIDPIKPLNCPAFEDWLNMLSPHKTLEQYQINTNLTLGTFLLKLREEFNSYKIDLTNCLKDKLMENKGLSNYLKNQDNVTIRNAGYAIEKLSKKIAFEYADFNTYNDLELIFKKMNVIEDFLAVTEKEKIVMNWINKFEELKSYSFRLLRDIAPASIGSFSLDKQSLLFQFNKAEELLPELLHAFSLWNQCLLTTPRGIVKELLLAPDLTENLIMVKEGWAKIWAVGQALHNGKLPEEDFSPHLLFWGTIDFHEIRNELNRFNKRTSQVIDVISRIYNDMSWGGEVTLKEAVLQINQCADIRPAIRRQLVQLLSNGHTSLPTVQWKKLIEEMKIRFPTVFEIVEVKLVLENDL